jgi:hypothetical protein
LHSLQTTYDVSFRRVLRFEQQKSPPSGRLGGTRDM